jgi:hypothetical protein
MVKVGQMWMRKPSMEYYWGVDVGKLVIVDLITNDTIYYRYLDTDSSGKYDHFSGSRDSDKFIERFQLYKDI